jgi:myo-inositol-1-phosphate synthase
VVRNGKDLAPRRVGVWLCGARGSLATTVVLGARAIARGLSGTTGLVTALPELRGLPLIAPSEVVFGGWDVADTRLSEQARVLAVDDRAIPADLPGALAEDLEAVERSLRRGYVPAAGGRAKPARAAAPRRESLAAAVTRLGDDLDAFRVAHRLDTVIVVNLSSTEGPIALGREHRRLDSFRRLIQADRRARVSASMVYAYAVLERGFPYLNFTPSPTLDVEALHELAHKQHVPFYGSDGKTGETLMKTVLAPLFRHRNLDVLSWEGFNILGGGDGRGLSDPRHKRSKVRTKSGVIAATLGYHPHTGVSIEYVPSLGNWKTAWDFVHFRGFLGTKMSMQFVWQGCDSILAAPLVIDLVRLTELAHRTGEAGPMPHLACFFKDPFGVSVHSFTDQFRLLTDYVGRYQHSKVASAPTGRAPRPGPGRGGAAARASRSGTLDARGQRA